MDICAKFGDSRLNSGRKIRLFGRQHPFCALMCSLWLHFAVEQKQLVTSYLAGLWGRLSQISVYNFVILAYTILEKFHLKPPEAAFLTGFFRDNFGPKVLVAIDVLSCMAGCRVGWYGCPWKSRSLCDGRTTVVIGRTPYGVIRNFVMTLGKAQVNELCWWFQEWFLPTMEFVNFSCPNVTILF